MTTLYSATAFLIALTAMFGAFAASEHALLSILRNGKAVAGLLKKNPD
jgi:hypothetical protein